MSDIMLYGVLRMPYEMAMSNEISRLQFYQRAQEAADRLEKCETTPNTTNSQAASFDQEEFDKMVEEGTKIWTGVDISRDASQAASIDTPEFRNRLRSLRNITMQETMDIELNEICDDIDAKIVQEWLSGFSSGAEAADIIQDKTNCELVKMEARATAAESRLAEIQRGVEGAEGYWRNAPHYDEVGSSEPQKEFFLADDIRALLQPQGQADTSGLPG